LQMMRRYDGKWVPKRNTADDKAKRDGNDGGWDDGDGNESGPRKKQKTGAGGFKEKGGFWGSTETHEQTKGGNRDRDKKKKSRPAMGTVTKGKKSMRREIKSVDQIKKQRKVAEFRQKKATKGKSKGKKSGKK